MALRSTLVLAALLAFVSGFDDISDQDVAKKFETILALFAKQEAVNKQLEIRLQQQETDLSHLRDTVAKLEEELREMKQKPPTDLSKVTKNTDKTALPRTCEEIRQSDHLSSSGMYYIDPDGTGIGDPAIYVYCDLTTGTTEISHDTESTIEADQCFDPGCYSRTINYNATLRQMSALSRLSTSCRQYFQFDCFAVPFQFDGVQQAWWNDRDGNPQYYWAGNNASQHACQCGIGGNCIGTSLNCNCDAIITVELSDQGYITNKDMLPVTSLHFGRTIAPGSYGRHTLGKLECSGRTVVDRKPESCSDLWNIGHSLSGFYSVQKGHAIQSVYCDFSKTPEDSGLETAIGTIDIKLPVYFYVQRNSNYRTVGTIPYQIEVLNVGRAMDISSGIFTAPRNGIYFFMFGAFHNFDDINGMAIGLYLNGVQVSAQSTYTVGKVDDIPLALSATLELRTGDQVSARLHWGGIYDTSEKYTSFSGFQLHEELF